MTNRGSGRLPRYDRIKAARKASQSDSSPMHLASPACSDAGLRKESCPVPCGLWTNAQIDHLAQRLRWLDNQYILLLSNICMIIVITTVVAVCSRALSVFVSLIRPTVNVLCQRRSKCKSQWDSADQRSTRLNGIVVRPRCSLEGCDISLKCTTNWI